MKIFTEIMYKDPEFPNLPYDMNSDEIKSIPVDKYYTCGLVTMGYHIEQAFSTYTLLMPYIYDYFLCKLFKYM